MATKSELTALAVPVASALGSFTDPMDGLVAMFVFGLAVGIEDPVRAARLADVGETIIRTGPNGDDEFENFLLTNLAAIRSALA